MRGRTTWRRGDGRRRKTRVFRKGRFVYKECSDITKNVLSDFFRICIFSNLQSALISTVSPLSRQLSFVKDFSKVRIRNRMSRHSVEVDLSTVYPLRNKQTVLRYKQLPAD